MLAYSSPFSSSLKLKGHSILTIEGVALEKQIFQIFNEVN